jgi:hypothetical protein
VLGIGGLRVLKALGLQPTVFHMNEGHAAFQAIERIRILMAEQKLSLEEALEASRTNNVFTTHTPLPAGIDVFDTGLMRQYFEAYCRETGIGFDQFMALGRRNPQDGQETFSMAISALKTSATARRSPRCTARYRRRCLKVCGRNSRYGKSPSRRSPTEFIFLRGSTETLPLCTISTWSPIGAKDMPSQKCGSRSPTFRIRNCGRRTAAENAAWSRSCGKTWWLALRAVTLPPPKLSGCRTSWILKLSPLDSRAASLPTNARP